MVEARIVPVQVQEPAEQQVVVQLLTEHPLTAHRVERHQERSFQQPLWRVEGRPTSLYICSNSGEISLSATSANSLISLIGWLAGTRCSGFTKVSIVLCGRSYPRIFLFLLNPPPSLNYTDAKPPVDPVGEEFFNILLGESPRMPVCSPVVLQ